MSFINGNPLLSEERFLGAQDFADTMTVKGTVQKTAILFFIVVFSGAITWSTVETSPNLYFPVLIIGAIGGIIALLIGMSKPETGRISAPIYAIFEGLFLGAVSLKYNYFFEGIVGQAIILTLGILLIMIGLYSGGFLKATNTFVKVVTISTIGVCSLYIITFLINMISGTTVLPFLHDSGPISIGFSVIVVILAALNFVIDFDMVEKGEQHGAPRHMEWFGAMAIMVTLIWLYVNILRLLSKLASRD
jgi:uncharacterized YccA/Bax inhibitor family protein